MFTRYKTQKTEICCGVLWESTSIGKWKKQYWVEWEVWLLCSHNKGMHWSHGDSGIGIALQSCTKLAGGISLL